MKNWSKIEDDDDDGAQRFDWNEEFKQQTLRAKKKKWVVMKSWSKMEDDDDGDGAQRFDRMESLRSKHWGKKKWVMMKSRREFDDDDDDYGGGGGAAGAQRFNWMRSFCSKLTTKLLRKTMLGVMEK
jgi:hypothetical protein